MDLTIDSQGSQSSRPALFLGTLESKVEGGLTYSRHDVFLRLVRSCCIDGIHQLLTEHGEVMEQFTYHEICVAPDGFVYDVSRGLCLDSKSCLSDQVDFGTSAVFLGHRDGNIESSDSEALLSLTSCVLYSCTVSDSTLW